MIGSKYHTLTHSHSEMFPDWEMQGVELNSLEIVQHPEL